MQTIIILGAGQFGKAVSDLIDPNQFKLQAFGDNSPFLWNTEIQTAFGKVPVVSIEQAAAFKPDLILIAVSDAARSQMLMDQVKTAGYGKKCMLLHELYRTFDIRSATLHRMAKRVSEGNIPGDIAELGVFRGNIAWQLNALFPDRQLLLFDTFEGFSRKDIQIETDGQYSKVSEKTFSDTSVEYVRNRLPFPQNALFYPGYFPETTKDIPERSFAFISLDADLYAPIRAGLEYFYPRLSSGGMILLHDYNNTQFRGCREAVRQYEEENQALLLVPLSDLHGTAVIIKS